MDSSKGLCQINSVCGHSLHDGVIFVGIATAVIATVTCGTAITAIGMIATKKLAANKNPVYAVNLIVALVFCPMSLYQFIISLLLVFQAVRLAGNVFLSTLWFTSHLSILVVYSILFIVKTVICIYFDFTFIGVLSMIFGSLYVAVFIYFEMIVHSYLDTLECDRYY